LTRTCLRRAVDRAVWGSFFLLIAVLFNRSIQVQFTLPKGQLAHLETDPSLMNRFVYFDAALRMVRDHRVAGIGFESHGLLYPRYRPLRSEIPRAGSVKQNRCRLS
jgi:O-antigen ligase